MPHTEAQAGEYVTYLATCSQPPPLLVANISIFLKIPSPLISGGDRHSATARPVKQTNRKPLGS